MKKKLDESALAHSKLQKLLATEKSAAQEASFQSLEMAKKEEIKAASEQARLTALLEVYALCLCLCVCVCVCVCVCACVCVCVCVGAGDVGDAADAALFAAWRRGSRGERGGPEIAALLRARVSASALVCALACVY